MRYAEQFGVEPHRVNPPVLWWRRWTVWQDAQASRKAHAAAKDNPEWAATMTADDTRALLWADKDDGED